MKGEHHSQTLRAAADLAAYWHDQKEAGNEEVLPLLDIDKVYAELENVDQVEQMARDAKGADYVKDVVVDATLEAWIIDRVSDATSFQHFAYGGSMGTLKDGKKVVEKYGGYCWDCDPYLKWYEELANISTADVRFEPDCGVFDEDFYKKSPGYDIISGKQDWDNQIYPSALELAEFYGVEAQALKAEKPGWAQKSLCYAIHMLQDMSVPHHILCTIEYGHGDYEKDMLDFWKRFYSTKENPETKQAVLEQLSEEVAALLNDPLADRAILPDPEAQVSFADIGRVAVDLTRERQLPTRDAVPARNKIEAREMTVQAIACTLKAVELF